MTDNALVDFREMIHWLRRNKRFSTYDLLTKRTFTKVQFFEHPMSPGNKEQDAVSICLPGDICSEWEIFLYPDGTWELK